MDGFARTPTCSLSPTAPKSPAALCVAAAALVFWAAVPAVAFEVLGYSWEERSATFRVNPNFPDAAVSGSREQQIDIMRSSAETWRTQSAMDFELICDERESDLIGFERYDGINNVSWVDADGGDARAATLIDLDPLDGRITGFDIVFFDRSNGRENRWNGPRDPPAGTLDIRGVAVHELGHALGLDHEPDISEATMFPGVRSRGRPLRTLHQDDIAGVESIYGRRQDPQLGLAITAVEPPNGPPRGMNEVTIRGRSFTWKSDMTVIFDHLEVPSDLWEVESGRTIRISSLFPGAGPVDVEVRSDELSAAGVGSGTAVLPSGYRYGPPAPVLLSVEPPVGPLEGGVAVTVRGEHFREGATVRIGGAPLEGLSFVDRETVTGALPAAAAAGAVDVLLEQSIDTAELPGGFLYTAKTLRIGEAAACPGDEEVSVDVFASSDESIRGFSFVISHDPALLEIDDITVEGTAASGAFLCAADLDGASGVATFRIVMSDTEDGGSIPAGDDLHVATMLTSVPDAAPVGARIPLRVEEVGGFPPVELLFSTETAPLGARPFWIDGQVSVVERASFLRGDADANGRLEITDAIFHFAALFHGGPPPACGDAADANDDGSADISDGIYTLVFLFQGGPRPSPPYPDFGPDPTPDDLGCGL